MPDYPRIFLLFPPFAFVIVQVGYVNRVSDLLVVRYGGLLLLVIVIIVFLQILLTAIVSYGIIR